MQIIGSSLYIFAIVLLRENSATPAIRPQSQRGIIYPQDNWDDCFVDEASRIAGRCKLVDECPEVLKKWQKEKIYPKTCYFIKKEQFVCCPLAMGVTTMEAITVRTTRGTTSGPSLLELTGLRRSDLECDLNTKVEATIVNGTPANPDEFPFMAALGWTSNFDNKPWYRCGGAVISPKFVLTAAHCAEIGGEFPSLVRIGGSNLTDASVRDVKIKRFIKHPQYNAKTVYNDIALIELEEEAKDIYAPCLWSEETLISDNVIAVGYGHTQFGGIASNQLLKTDLKIVTHNDCQQYYGTNSDAAPSGIGAKTHLCAGDPERLRDTCQGDSGGPLILEKINGRFKRAYIVGVTSFGLGCAGEPPSIYTRVSSYLDWIERIVWSADII
ncbi:serine protease snake [Musca domestica]|uniref:Serine protease snake-like n=1 Tax=Musca domestica TaxID=7370 RepID=A0A1I8N3C0_MUSDO|nr:serine protease snake [Musca domestica]